MFVRYKPFFVDCYITPLSSIPFHVKALRDLHGHDVKSLCNITQTDYYSNLMLTHTQPFKSLGSVRFFLSRINEYSCSARIF